jgi:hypothetical protein
LGPGGVIGGSHSLYGQIVFKSGPDIPKWVYKGSLKGSRKGKRGRKTNETN